MPKPHGIHIPEPFDYELVLGHMCKELKEFCELNKVPHMSADELLSYLMFTVVSGSASEMMCDWLSDFIERWDYAQKQSDSPFGA